MLATQQLAHRRCTVDVTITSSYVQFANGYNTRTEREGDDTLRHCPALLPRAHAQLNIHISGPGGKHGESSSPTGGLTFAAIKIFDLA